MCVVYRTNAVRDQGRLRAGLELMEAVAPGAMSRDGRDFGHYWSLIRAGANSVWCVEDRDGVVGIFLGTPRTSRLLYYDVVVCPQATDPQGTVAELVRTGSAAAYEFGAIRLMSHDPLDGAEFYESLGHVPTMRVQLNGADREQRRRALVAAMAGYRLLDLGEAEQWVDAHFRVDRVDPTLKAELSQPEQYAMHMMHRWADPDDRSSYVVSGYRRFARAISTELREINPGLTDLRRLSDSTMEMTAGAPGHQLVPATKADPAVFTHSVAPVDREVMLTGGSDDVDLIVEAARSLPLRPHHSFAAECRKGVVSVGGRHSTTAYTTRDIEIRVGTALGSTPALPVDLASPDQIVSIYLEGNRALLGLTDPPYADQHRRRAGRPTLVSRAEHKLAEALDLFAVALPAGSCAIDLGAAPGGWTYLLAERGLQVYAVDPGELDPKVAAHPLVTLLRTRADNLEPPATPVDLIVNDMNLDPVDSARLMSVVADHLRPGGPAIMTIKLLSTRPEPGISAAHSALAGAYDVLATRHLPHNRQEVTVLLRRRATQPRQL